MDAYNALCDEAATDYEGFWACKLSPSTSVAEVINLSSNAHYVNQMRYESAL